MSDAKPKSPDAIGPLDQFKLGLYASQDTNLTACDMACLMEILERFIKKDFDPHKAGVTFPVGHTHLVRETGRAVAAVKASLARLRGYGYIKVAPKAQARAAASTCQISIGAERFSSQ